MVGGADRAWTRTDSEYRRSARMLKQARNLKRPVHARIRRKWYDHPDKSHLSVSSELQMRLVSARDRRTSDLTISVSSTRPNARAWRVALASSFPGLQHW